MKKHLLLTVLIATVAVANAQYTPPDLSALEGIIVEPYYQADFDDAADTDGGPNLQENSMTYRVFVDLKPDYELQTVFGNTTHTLSISTTTEFWNNTDRGETTGSQIPSNRLDENTVAIDTWVAMGAASDSHFGVLKAADSDGSIVGGTNNDGGSNSVPAGLLAASNGCMNNLALTTSDGIEPGAVPSVTTIGINLDVFDDQNGPSFSTNNGAWSVLGGVVGPTPDNKILIGQFTTDGEFSFEFNIIVGIPPALQCNAVDCHTYIEYVATLVPADTLGGGVNADNVAEFAGLSGNLPLCLGVGVDSELQASSNISLFPNPASANMSVNVESDGAADVDLVVIDLAGRVLSQTKVGKIGKDWTGLVDLTNLSAGHYQLIVQSSTGVLGKQTFVKF